MANQHKDNSIIWFLDFEAVSGIQEVINNGKCLRAVATIIIKNGPNHRLYHLSEALSKCHFKCINKLILEVAEQKGKKTAATLHVETQIHK